MTRQACKQPNGVWLLHGAVCPERVGALQQIRVHRVHELNLDACQVFVPADRTRMREESNQRFPVEVGAALDLYLERVRRQWPLAYAARSGEAVHDDLWISKGGKPASPGTMAAAMKTATADILGYAVSPHRLRDRSATYIVEEMPTQAALASAILRHRSGSTTQQ